MKQLGKNENRRSWRNLFKKHKIFAKWFSLWNELVNFKPSEEIAWKFQNFRKLILSLKWIEILQSFINQIACSKNQTVCDFNQSINTCELYQISRSSHSLFQNLILRKLILSSKRFGTILRSNSLQKKVKFVRTGSFFWYIWKFSTFYSSITLLKKLKLSQIGSIYELKRKISETSWLKNLLNCKPVPFMKWLEMI